MRISTGGRGRWVDTVMIERPWWLLKRERVCPNAFETGAETRSAIRGCITHSGAEPPHSTRSGKTLVEAHLGRAFNAAA